MAGTGASNTIDLLAFMLTTTYRPDPHDNWTLETY